jgi:hypothetical protein
VDADFLVDWNGLSSARGKSSRFSLNKMARPLRGSRAGVREMVESQGVRHSQLMRLVNDRVFEVLSELGSEDGDFLCECSDMSCIETVQLTLREYAALRAREDRPSLKLPAHPD